MLKIAFDAKRLFLNHTGLGNYSRTLVQNLAKYHAEHQIHLFTPQLGKAYSQFSQEPYMIHLPPAAWPPGLWRTIGLLSQLNTIKPDVYHGLSHELPVGVNHLKMKRVVTMHDLIFMHYPGDFHWIDRKVYAAKWAHSIKNADKIIAISKHTAQDVIDHFRVSTDRVEVVYQACGTEYYQARPTETELEDFKRKHQLPEHYLLSVGSVIARKNLLQTVRALGAFPQKQRPCLIIVGEGGAYKQLVINEIADLKLEKWILWWPKAKVHTHELRLLYSGARATVFPSLYEGFGLPIAESLLCNTPVITSNISSLPEAAGPGALLIDPNRVDSISDAMQQLMRDDEICRRLAKEGLAYALEHFDPERTAHQLNQLYLSM